MVFDKGGKLLLGCLVLAGLLACGQQSPEKTTTALDTTNTPKQLKKMKVEIWSDVMCPFCYIGKRKFEQAIAMFPNKENIEVVWKSYQLNPSLVTDATKSTAQHLAESKGWSMERTKETMNYVVGMAKEVGLYYNFDKAVVANSFDAHRLIQYAKLKGKGDAAEEQLFKAYFIDGKNTADQTVLLSIGTAIGLEESELKSVLSGKQFAKEVLQDVEEAEHIGVTGVPFFVFDRKYAVSGAQDVKVFSDTLKKAFQEFDQGN